MADEAAKFEQWMAKPLEEIEKTSADAAFIAFMASFAMWERLVKSRIHAEKDTLRVRQMDSKQKNDLFYTLSAQMLGITDVTLFKNFWHMYRDGIAHYFQPMTEGMDGKKYLWRISADYGELPEYFDDPISGREIRINPWKWSRRVVKEWRSRPELLPVLQFVPFAEVTIEET